MFLHEAPQPIDRNTLNSFFVVAEIMGTEYPHNQIVRSIQDIAAENMPYAPRLSMSSALEVNKNLFTLEDPLPPAMARFQTIDYPHRDGRRRTRLDVVWHGIMSLYQNGQQLDLAGYDIVVNPPQITAPGNRQKLQATHFLNTHLGEMSPEDIDMANAFYNQPVTPYVEERPHHYDPLVLLDENTGNLNDQGIRQITAFARFCAACGQNDEDAARKYLSELHRQTPSSRDLQPRNVIEYFQYVTRQSAVLMAETIWDNLHRPPTRAILTLQ